jgi:hypothetical protein
MSKVTQLAAGQLTKSDTMTIELVKASDTPPAVLIRWPEAPSVLAPNTQALAAVAAAMVRVMAEAQAELAQLRRRRR